MSQSGLVADLFCGGGGTSLGIAWALGRSPDIAINHDDASIKMHSINHPDTHHVREDVWSAHIKELLKGRRVKLLAASPDCTHFSRAKGGKPVSKKIRSLAWVICKWADQAKPDVIIMENVREFCDFGPLVPRYACRACEWKGTEGQAKLARVHIRCPRCNAPRLKQIAEQFPDPARKGLSFKRWVGRLRNLGYKVEWKVINAADYGAPTLRHRLFVIARRDGEPIVWPEPTHTSPKKLDSMPLFDRLQPWRTAAECIEWDVPCPSIFDRKRPLKEATMRRIAMGIKRYVIEAEQPFIVPVTHSGVRKSHPLNEPLPTITSAKGGEFALVAPILTKFRTGSDGQPIDHPMPTVTANSFIKRPGGAAPIGLVTAFIAKHYGGMVGVQATEPLPTTTAKGCQNQILAANLIHLNHGEKQWSSVDEPLRTLTSGGNHAALVYSFLIRYFGTAIGQHCTEPLYTITGKDRFGLVVVHVAGEPYVIVDIGMRMLTPRELARAQGFPDTYMLTGTKTSQVARIGNSVCPHVAKALVEANCVDSPLTVRA